MPIELPQSDVRAIANLPDFSGLPILRPAIISAPFSPAELPPGRPDLLVLTRSNTGWWGLGTVVALWQQPCRELTVKRAG